MPTSTDPPIEKWSTVPGLPPEYEVSTLGRVRITVTRLPRKAGDILKRRPGKSGLRIELSINKKQVGHQVKSLVLRAFSPSYSIGDEIFHLDGDPSNCALDNLTTAPMGVPLPPPLFPDEVWKPFPVPKYADHYVISNYGRVCPTKRSKIFPNGGVKKPAVMDNGYLTISVSCGDGSGKTFLLHRMVALAFLGPPPVRGMVADHIDRDRGNPALTNLRWVTSKENHALNDDRFQDFKCLSHEDANEIRRRYNAGEKQVDIADDYGISQNQVSMCVLNKAWKRKNDVPIEKAEPFVPTEPHPVEWRACPSFPWFEVSNTGAVRYAACTSKRGEVLSQHLSHGYPRVQAYLSGMRHGILVHQLIADAFLGPAEGRFVNHKNHDRTCAWVTNLEYVTGHGNMRHRYGYKYDTA